MKVKKIKSDSTILHENSQVKLKICGTCRDIQLTAGVNTKCPIQNISKDKYLDKETESMKTGTMSFTPMEISIIINMIRTESMGSRLSEQHVSLLTMMTESY